MVTSCVCVPGVYYGGIGKLWYLYYAERALGPLLKCFSIVLHWMTGWLRFKGQIVNRLYLNDF